MKATIEYRMERARHAEGPMGVGWCLMKRTIPEMGGVLVETSEPIAVFNSEPDAVLFQAHLLAGRGDPTFEAVILDADTVRNIELVKRNQDE